MTALPTSLPRTSGSQWTPSSHAGSSPKPRRSKRFIRVQLLSARSVLNRVRSYMAKPLDVTGDGASLEDALENAFVEQAEYISEADFAAWNAEHPGETTIVRRLSLG